MRTGFQRFSSLIRQPPPVVPTTAAREKQAVVAGCLSDEQDGPAAGGEGELTTGDPPLYAGPFFLDVETGRRTTLAEGVAGNALAYVPSPDGTRLAYGPCCNGILCSPGEVTIVANIDGSGARTLEASEGGNVIRGARWSPDGTKLVYQERIGETRDVGRLVIENLASGRRTLVTDPKLTVANWYFLWPRFSADGKKVIFHLARGPHGSSKFDVWSVSVTGGKPKLVLRDASFPVPFPDGETIAFVPGARGFYGYSIAIADSQGSGRRTLVETRAPIWWPAISPDGRKLTYVVGNSVILAEVSTGKHERVAYGTSAEWLDDHTLIVGP